MSPEQKLILATIAWMFVPVFLCGFAACDLVTKSRQQKGGGL